MRGDQAASESTQLRVRVEIVTRGDLHHSSKLRLHAVPARAAQRMIALSMRTLPARPDGIGIRHMTIVNNSGTIRTIPTTSAQNRRSKHVPRGAATRYIRVRLRGH